MSGGFGEASTEDLDIDMTEELQGVWDGARLEWRDYHVI